MNTRTHLDLNPLHGRLPQLIRHEKVYRTIHSQLMKKWFQFFVLF